MATNLVLLRLPQVLAARGCGRAKHYQDVQTHLWTKPVAVGKGYSAWPEHEVQALISAQIGGADVDTLKTLVERLHAQRKCDFQATASRYLHAAISTAT